MAPRLKASEVTFLELQPSVFCVECELISYNNGPYCLACGSQALLSLSRVLGGSLRNQPRAQLISDAALEQVVADLLRSESEPLPWSAEKTSYGEILRPGGAPGVEIEPALASSIPAAVPAALARAYELTHAAGAALAVYDGQRYVCGARLGEVAPDLGVEARPRSGLSGLCLETGRVSRCAEAAADPYADRETCRRLGAQSIVAAPLLHLRQVLGVLEVLSPAPGAFNDGDVASVQLLAQLMVVAFVRASWERKSLKAPAGCEARALRAPDFDSAYPKPLPQTSMSPA